MIQSRQSFTTVLMTMNSQFDKEHNGAGAIQLFTLRASPCIRYFTRNNRTYSSSLLLGKANMPRESVIRGPGILNCTSFGRDSAAHTYPLFPDLLENQKKSVRRFWTHGLSEEFELFSYASGKKKHLHMIFHGTKFFLEKSISSLPVSKVAHAENGGLAVSANASLSNMESMVREMRIRTQAPIQRILEEQKTYSVSLFIPIEFQCIESEVPDIEYGMDFAQESQEIPNTVKLLNEHNTYSNSPFKEINTRNPIPGGESSIRTLRQSVTNGQRAKIFLEKHGRVQLRNCTVPIYFGEIPLMTERGSFFINGSARVLVNQIVRCPSIYFKVKIDQKNRRTYIGSFLSEYGSWLRLETDYKNRIWVRIDKSQRISIYALLRSLGFPERFLEYQCKHYPFLFASREEYYCEDPHEAIQYIWKKLTPGRWNSLQGCYTFLYNKFFHPRRYSIGKIGRLQLNKRFSRKTNLSFANKIPTLTPEDIFMALETLIDFHYGEGLLDDIDHLKNRRVRLPGELMQNQLRLALSRLTQTATEKLSKFELDEFAERGESFSKGGITYSSDSSANLQFEIGESSEYAGMRGMIAQPRSGAYDRAESIRRVEPSNSNPRISLARLGQVSSLSAGENSPYGVSQSEDTSQIRGVINQQFREATPPARKQNMQSMKDCIQTQVFGSAFRELFNTSQLSQYMDQTNPLAEITHKRRLSSLGPGGIGRDQAGFAVREIHPSHFGRICPIETPEGQNAGLVGSLATYSRITSDGFLQSPYYQARDREHSGIQTQSQTRNDWFFFSAEIEDESYISFESPSQIDSSFLVNENPTDCIPESKPFHTRKKIEKYPIRYKQEFFSVDKNQIQFFGVSPIQMISLATSLIPFLEHDDANRALMGSNMQRQAVPLLFAEKPFIGTGLESQAARDSSTCLLAKKSGQVISVNGLRIDILTSSWSSYTATERGSNRASALNTNSVDKYLLQKYWRSNQNTCLRQTPRVRLGEWVEKGDLLADGSATLNGEVALGKNIFVAYMPWEGYNFEDAIVINERLVQEDIYTSIHIDRYDVETRDTEHGKERITRDVHFLSFGNIQGQSQIRDSKGVIANSPGLDRASALMQGVAGEYTRSESGEYVIMEGVADEYTGEYNSTEQSFEYLDTRGIISPGTWVEEGDILVGKLTPIAPPKPTPEYRLLLAIFETKPLPFKDTSLRVPSGIEGRVLECVCSGEAVHAGEIIEESSGRAKLELNSLTESMRRDSRTKIEKVHVFLVHKRKIQLGDKMSGRHGNKGIVSLILPPQDMPFLQDGTPVDIVLNPLGVPSRMNVGQVLECLFGFATKYLKQNYRLCAFDEMYGTDDTPDVSRGLVYTKLYEAACQTGYQWLFDPNHPGKSHLFDGRTGEAFHQPVLVGYSYMFKLIHLVDEKMHARSTGPYSLVTQQPLGGRSKHGGQRLGEMEVWALEGFGAAAVLHEFLTLKSDDIDARNTFLFHLMKRRHFPQERLRRCLPESFRVLVHELQSLCLSVYYNPDFRLTYPSLLGWDGLFLLSSKKLPTLDQLGQLKIA